MSKYIDTDRLIAKIQPHYENAKCKARYAAQTGISSDCTKWNYAKAIYEHILRIISSLQQEYSDYEEAIQLVFEEQLTPFKDGNQWYFLLGRDLQDGICGFGDTILDAAVDFYKNYMNTKIHIGELEISMAQQEQPDYRGFFSIHGMATD